MRKTGIFVVLGILALGLVGFAGQQGAVVSVNTVLGPYTLFQELTEYDLSGSGYQDAAATGWFYSSSGATQYWHCKLTTNRKVNITFDFSNAQFKHTVTAETLPTDFRYKVIADKVKYSGTWYTSFDPGWLGWNPASATGAWFAGFQKVDPADFEFWVEVRVYRNGYHDRAGTYTSTVSCIVTY